MNWRRLALAFGIVSLALCSDPSGPRLPEPEEEEKEDPGPSPDATAAIMALLDVA